jgi:hypothetical protein
MAVIKIKDLGAPGSMLFSDSETYLNELTNEDFWGINGGIGIIGVTLIVTAFTAYNAINQYLYRNGGYRKP